MSSPPERDLRVGVVGMGIGQLHLLSWLEVADAEVIALAESDRERRQQAGKNWDLPAVSSLDELLDLNLDVIDLCTPPAQHEDQIVRCLEAGVHVICEKPLVGSVAACDRLAEVARAAEARSGALLMPILQYRFGGGVGRARALVEAGVTGRLYTASASTWWRRDRDYYDGAEWRASWDGALGGTIVNHAVHTHDLLTWIGGPLGSVQARTATRVNNTETEDCAVAIGTTVDGALMTMNATTGAATESTTLRWAFEHVTIESTTEAYHPGRAPWRFDFRSPEAEQRAEEVWGGRADQGDQYTGQFRAFVEAIGSGGPLPVTLADAAATLELITAWYASARSGAPEALPLPQDHPNRESWRP